MKTSTMNLLLVTAAVIAGSTNGFAQTLTANIPIEFRAGGAAMAPGPYKLSPVPGPNGEDRFLLRDLSSNKSVLLIPGIRENAPRAWTQSGQPKLAFTCGDNGCALTRLWMANGSKDYEFASPQNEQPRHKLTETFVAAVKTR